MKALIGMIAVASAVAAAVAFVFGDLPTVALSTDIASVNSRVDLAEERFGQRLAASEAFMLDEAIDRLQLRIWSNIDRQQTYLDKGDAVPTNLREQLRGFEREIEKLKRRRSKLP